MEAISAVVALVRFVGGAVQEARNNRELVQRLYARLERVAHLLEAIPQQQQEEQQEQQRVAEQSGAVGGFFGLVVRLHELVHSARDLVKTLSESSNPFRVRRQKQQVQYLEGEIDRCVQDLILAASLSQSVVAGSAAAVAAAGEEDGGSGKAEEEKADGQDGGEPWEVDYEQIQFVVNKRGIRKELGTGGFGRVFLATFNDMQVAVKEPLDQNALTPAAKEEFAREVALCHRLNHPNIVAVYGGCLRYFDHEDNDWADQAAMVLEYLPNKSLATLLYVDRTVLSTEQVLLLTYGIGSALVYLHGSHPPILHRDLKPENILLGENYHPKLIDFGLAKVKTDTTRGNTTMRGSIEWMAPEQLEGRTSTKSDIFAFGLIALSCLTRDRPHEGVDNMIEIAERIRNGVRTNPPDTVPADLLALFHTSCCHADPEQRPLAATALSSIERMCASRGVHPRDFGLRLPLPDAPSAAATATGAGSPPPAGARDMELPEGDASLAMGFEAFDTMEENIVTAAKSIVRFDAEPMTQRLQLLAGDRELDDSIRFDARLEDTLANPAARLSLVGEHVTMFGSKVLVEMRDAVFAASVAAGSLAGSHDSDEVEEEEAEEGKGGQSKAAAAARTAGAGTVVFSIDTTGSMSRFDRMVLTRAVLHRTIPRLWRCGLDVELVAWSVRPTTQGRIRTRSLDCDPDWLQGGEAADAAVASYLDGVFDELLVTGGRTDLLGATYQLLEHTRTLREPVSCYVLTDGKQNEVAEPLHTPTEGEDYFGIYVGRANGTWGTTGFGFQEERAIDFLAQRFLSLESERPTSLTILGIGEAETAFLSKIVDKAGASASFYGVTQVDMSETCIDPARMGALQVLLLPSMDAPDSDALLTCSYTELGEDGTLVGSALADDDTTRAIASGTHLVLGVVDPAGRLTRRVPLSRVADDATVLPDPTDALHMQQHPKVREEHARQRHEAEEVLRNVWDCVLQLPVEPYQVRDTPYALRSVFRQLQSDRVQLNKLLRAWSTRKLRKWKRTPTFRAIRSWIGEALALIDGQIAAYRQNFEASVLEKLAGNATGAAASVEGAPDAANPVVLERIKNNLKNAGLSGYRVKRMLQAVQSIRDRSLELASRLSAQQLTIEVEALPSADDAQGVVCLIRAPAGTTRTFKTRWNIPAAEWDATTALLEPQLPPSGAPPVTLTGPILGDVLLNTTALRRERSTDSLRSTPSAADVLAPLARGYEFDAYPCILLCASMDATSIVHNIGQFTVRNVVFDLTQQGVARACMSELWEFLSTTDRAVGEPIPFHELSDPDMLEHSATCNMVCATAHTPLLQQLFVQKSRQYQSALNVTGSLLALVPASLQFQKFFHDLLLLDHPIPLTSSVSADDHTDTGGAEESKGAGTSSNCDGDRKPAAVDSPANADDPRNDGQEDWKRLAVVEEAVRALVSYRLSFTVHAMAPTAASMRDLFGELPEIAAAGGGAATADSNDDEAQQALESLSKTLALVGRRAKSGEAAETEVVDLLFSRDSAPGLSAPRVLASLLVTPEDYGRSAHQWQRWVLTVFSRMCEAISGHKIVRIGGGNARGLADPKALELKYRYTLWDLQAAMATKFVDWPRLSWEHKMEKIEEHGDAVMVVVRRIIRNFLAKLTVHNCFGWRAFCVLLRRAIILHNIGIVRLAESFERCDREDVDRMMRTVLASTGSLSEETLALGLRRMDLSVGMSDDLDFDMRFPVVTSSVDTRSGTRGLRLERLEHHPEMLVSVLDAIVATHAVPRAAPQPKVHQPALPTMDPATLAASQPTLRGFDDYAMAHCMVTIVGDTNVGKSTLLGRILFEAGVVDARDVSKMSQAARAVGRNQRDVRFSWLSDTSAEERALCRTCKSRPRPFSCSLLSRRVSFVDNPGHADQLMAAISGIHAADAAVLLVSAVAGELENSLSGGRVTEHLIAAYCFGIRSLVVAVNKLDLVPAGEEEAAFTAVVNKVSSRLRQIGFDAAKTVFVPVVAVSGQNLLPDSRDGGAPAAAATTASEGIDDTGDDRHADLGWYSGRSLVEAMESSLPTPRREVTRAFRLPVAERFKVRGAGTVVAGRVECGTVRVGMRVRLVPGGDGKAEGSSEHTIRSIEMHHDPVEEAQVGDDVGICISGAISSEVRRGMVLGPADGEGTPRGVRSFVAQIVFLQCAPQEMNRGFKPTVIAHQAKFDARLVRVHSILDRRSGKVLEDSNGPSGEIRTVRRNTTAVVEFTLETTKAVCLEPAASSRLGRVVLVANRRIFGIGMIRSVQHDV